MALSDPYVMPGIDDPRPVEVGCPARWDDPGWRVFHLVEALTDKDVIMRCGTVYPRSQVVRSLVTAFDACPHKRCLEPGNALNETL